MSGVKPTGFSGVNMMLMGSEDVEDLPVFRDDSMVVSCWKVSFLKRVKLLFTGKIWFCAQGKTHVPIKIDIDKPFD